MPKFLSFHSPTPKELKENPLKALWESFQSLDSFTKGFFITVFLLILATSFIVNNLQIFTPRAQQPEPTLGAKAPPSILILASLYEGAKSKLKTDDGVLISIARQQGSPDTPISSTVFNNAINTLNKVPTGVKKILMFSSIEDIKTFIGSVPLDVEQISYNSETALTPSSERVDFYATIQEGADIAHAKGKKFGFGPLRGDFDKMQTSGELARILPLIDSIGYQGQLLYLSVGEDETVRIAQEKYNYVKSINPNVVFQFQMWVGRETTDQIISTFNKLQDFMNAAVIGGASSSQEIITIIDGLTWNLATTPTSSPSLAPTATIAPTIPPATPTPTPTPTLTPTPTPTPIPTSTPTPIPTSTPTPTPKPLDTIPPTVSITNPINGSIVAPNTSIIIVASPSDNVGITKVEFYVSDSTRPKCTNTTPPYTCLWKVPGRTGAFYTLTAKAYDVANNSSIGTVVVSTRKGFFDNFFDLFR